MSRNKKKVRKPLGDPIFSYESVCCNQPATKKPCAVDYNTPFDDRNKAEHSLGTWRCSSCKNKAKVKRTKVKKEVEVD